MNDGRSRVGKHEPSQTFLRFSTAVLKICSEGGDGVEAGGVVSVGWSVDWVGIEGAGVCKG